MTTKQEPEVERDAHGRLTKGTPNPGGLTQAERAARDLMRRELGSPDMFQAWRAGYLAQLMEQNPLILKDYADRVGGKPKERVEVSGDAPDWLANLAEKLKDATLEQVLELARSEK